MAHRDIGPGGVAHRHYHRERPQAPLFCPGDRDAPLSHAAFQALPVAASAAATWRCRSPSVLMLFRSSSDTLTPNSSSILNMNSMKDSESMPSESSGAAGSSALASRENSLLARSLMRPSVSIGGEIIDGAETLIICGVTSACRPPYTPSD